MTHRSEGNKKTRSYVRVYGLMLLYQDCGETADSPIQIVEVDIVIVLRHLLPPLFKTNNLNGKRKSSLGSTYRLCMQNTILDRVVFLQQCIPTTTMHDSAARRPNDRVSDARQKGPCSASTVLDGVHVK